jgi:hypothetical protein
MQHRSSWVAALRGIAFIANGVAIALFLFAALLLQVADVGQSEALEGSLWLIAFAAAALFVILSALWPTRFRPYLLLPYGAVGIFWIAAGWTWIEHFNLSSEIQPSLDAILLGVLGLIDLLLITAAIPIPLRMLLRSPLSRWMVGSTTASALAFLGVTTYQFIERAWPPSTRALSAFFSAAVACIGRMAG